MTKNSCSSVSETKTIETSWITNEIQLMMFGMGDSCEPLLASVMLVEEVMVRQLRSAIIQAEEVAICRGSRTIQPQDFVFLMRNDKVKLHRLFKYLALKDGKNTSYGSLSLSDSTDEDLDENDDSLDYRAVSTMSKRSRDCLAFLKSIGCDPQLERNLFDIVKYERNVRADKISSSMSTEKYTDYSEARRASFSNTPAKLSLLYDRLFSQEIGTPDEPKLSQASYDIVGYLGHETVAQIVDSALLVRQDAGAQVGDPTTYHMSTTEIPSYTIPMNEEVEGEPPLTVNEIREALRRYWSPQFSPYTTGTTIHTRLLAI